MIRVGQHRIDLTYVGLILFMISTIVNTAQFGASLSWVIIPCMIILLGLFCGKQYVDRSACLIYIFYLFCFISTMFSHYVRLQRDMLTFAFFCIIYILVVSHKYSIEQIKQLNKIYIIVALFISLNILYNWITHNYYIEWFKRASFSFAGVYKDPNYVMAFIVPAMILCLFKIFFERNYWKKFLFALFELIMMTNFITTGSRGPLLTFLLSVILFFISKSSMSATKKIKLMFMIGLVIISGWNILLKVLPVQSIERLFHSTSDSRTKLWESALVIFYNNPILGGGEGAASKASVTLLGNYSHNVYLDILVNSGILGFISFLLFFVINCMQTSKKNIYFILPMGIAFMFPLFFINGFNTATFYLPLIYMSILSRFCIDKNFHAEELLL